VHEAAEQVAAAHMKIVRRQLCSDVSALCSSLQFVATTNRSICSTFQFCLVGCSSSNRTFNPEVAGSNPARPI
jgi:hypothetical protein